MNLQTKVLEKTRLLLVSIFNQTKIKDGAEIPIVKGEKMATFLKLLTESFQYALIY